MAFFFYNVMIGDTSFFNVYQEVFAMCMNKFLSFTKTDIDEMPPFERIGYVTMLEEFMEEYNENIKKANESKSGTSVPAFN